MTIPEEIVLATRLELGLAGPTELSDLVDRRIESAAHVDGVLLELATPLDLAVDDLSSRLASLANVSKERGAAMRVVVVADLVARDLVSLERAVGYLTVRAAPSLPKPLDAECGALDDELWAVTSGTFGTMQHVHDRLNDVAAACRVLCER